MTEMLPGLLADDTLLVAVEYAGATARHAVGGMEDVNMPLVARVRVTRRPLPTQPDPPSEWRAKLVVVRICRVVDSLTQTVTVTFCCSSPHFPLPCSPVDAVRRGWREALRLTASGVLDNVSASNTAAATIVLYKATFGDDPDDLQLVGFCSSSALIASVVALAANSYHVVTDGVPVVESYAGSLFQTAQQLAMQLWLDSLNKVSGAFILAFVAAVAKVVAAVIKWRR
jgi:hypothetical protein